MPLNQNQQLYRRQNISDMESLVSVVAGSGLAFSGLRRQRSLARTLLGGALIYRGLARHCPIYQAAGIHRAETANERSAVVTILRSPEEIYQFCSEMRNFPQFVSFLENVQPDEGNLYRWTLKTPGGRRYEWKVEVYEQSEGHVLRMAFAQRRAAASRRFSRVQAGARQPRNESTSHDGVSTRRGTRPASQFSQAICEAQAKP